MKQSEFLICILATVAKVSRALGGLAFAAVVIDIYKTVVDWLKCWDMQN